MAAGSLSTRQTEALVKRLRTDSSAPSAPPPEDLEKKKSASVRDLEARLERSLGARVKLHDQGGGRGRIEIPYLSLDDLDRILDKLLRP